MYKGIQRGDKNFRHFTFDENDFIVKDNVKYYKVNYGKSNLEGPDAEDETGYIDAPNIIVLGGKKPSFSNPVQSKPVIEEKPAEISNSEQEKETKSKPVSKKPQEQKRPVGRPKKVKPDTDQITTVSSEVSKALLSGLNTVKKEMFEYTVKEFVVKDVDTLKEQLNLLGSDGWEMCGFDTYRTLFTDIRIMAIFKKRVS